MTVRLYRVALAISLVLNVLLLTIFWAYLHFEGTLSIIEEAVSIFD